MYHIDLKTAHEIQDLLKAIDNYDDPDISDKKLEKIFKKAEKLDNMKQFFKENL